MPRPLQDIVKRKSEPERAAGKVSKNPAAEPLQSRSLDRESSQIPVGRGSRYMLWSVAVFSVALLIVALSFMWGNAKVEVYPRTETIELNDNFAASKPPSSGGLGFELVVIHGEESRTLEATEEKELSQRAGGTVVIFNDYGMAAQRLDIDTRLNGSNGKLYKTKKQVSVPGRKADGTPGMAEADIYAAEAGEDYNSGPLDFDIAGFKGTPKEEHFKVRSKTGTEITGGFKGKTLVASAAEKDAAVGELKTVLQEELFKKATGEIPDGFILFKDATVFVPDKIDLPLGGEELVVTLNGTLYGLLFKEEELAGQIALKKMAGYENEPVFVRNLRDLKFILGNIGDVSLEAMNNINLNLSGSVELVWQLDTDKFAQDLAGRSKKDFTSILSAYKNIDRAELTLSPFWKRMIPDEAKKIDVIINGAESD